MKTKIKTLKAISIIAMLTIIAVLPVNAQESNPQFRVSPAEASTNRDFINKLADPEFNPALAKKIQDPAERLKSAQAVADASCFDMSTTISVVSNAQGCFLDVTYVHPYTYDPSTNACLLPHGLFVEVCQPIQSVSVITGAWLTGVSPVISGNYVYFAKSCSSSGTNFSYLIPSGQTLTIRIKLMNGFCPGNNCPVLIKEMTGVPYNQIGWWSCLRTHNIPISVSSASIGIDASICTGNSLMLNMVPPPPPGTIVKWYKYIPTSCTSPCPTAPVSCPIGSPWGAPVLTGVGSYPTNILTQTSCFVAVAQNGCNTWSTNVKRVNVCPGPPSETINVNGPPTIPINLIPHTCIPWSGQLCLNNATTTCCAPKIIGWEKRSRTLSYPSACNPIWSAMSSWVAIPSTAGLNCINTGTLTSNVACQTQYEYRAVLLNACGQSTPTYTIIIDKQPIPGLINANPLVPLCYDKATKLTFISGCAEVVHWEMREETSPCSNSWSVWTGYAIPGSNGTCVWWTGNLLKSTQYRVKVKNGACSPVYSNIFTVTVKPKLDVTISANQTVLCPPGVTLTAQTTYGLPCSYSNLITYQWFRDGLPIGVNSPTYNPTSGGNYYVVVSDICGKATSNVITVCDKPQLVIKSPCCVCPGDPPILIEAIVLWTPSNCTQSCSFAWTGPGGLTASSQNISVTVPGTYTVTVTCGSCPQMIKTVTIIDCK
jgi:hypothetical protein